MATESYELGKQSGFYGNWQTATAAWDNSNHFDKRAVAKKQFMKGYKAGVKERKRLRNHAINISKSDWIPVHAIRKTSSGDIEVLTEKGTLSNPGKRKKFLAKIKKLFS